MDAEVLDSMSYETQAERFASRIEGGEPLLVAVEDGAVLGFATFGANRFPEVPCDSELHAIYVHPSAQGKGVGKALLRVGVADMICQGFTSMAVFAFKGNEAGVRFYESLGAVRYDEGEFEVSGKKYPDVSFVWRSLLELQARLGT